MTTSGMHRRFFKGRHLVFFSVCQLVSIWGFRNRVCLSVCPYLEKRNYPREYWYINGNVRYYNMESLKILFYFKKRSLIISKYRVFNIQYNAFVTSIQYNAFVTIFFFWQYFFTDQTAMACLFLFIRTHMAAKLHVVYFAAVGIIADDHCHC